MNNVSIGGSSAMRPLQPEEDFKIDLTCRKETLTIAVSPPVGYDIFRLQMQ